MFVVLFTKNKLYESLKFLQEIKKNECSKTFCDYFACKNYFLIAWLPTIDNGSWINGPVNKVG